jgi:hypothetical protein
VAGVAPLLCGAVPRNQTCQIFFSTPPLPFFVLLFVVVCGLFFIFGFVRRQDGATGGAAARLERQNVAGLLDA